MTKAPECRRDEGKRPREGPPLAGNFRAEACTDHSSDLKQVMKMSNTDKQTLIIIFGLVDLQLDLGNRDDTSP